MNTKQLERFAQYARKDLIKQVSIKLESVLAENSLARRENARAVYELEKEISSHDKNSVIDRVAYTWFNRFCALRFMDVKGYNRVKVLSPSDPSQFQPEILAEAKMGHIDDDYANANKQKQIFDLLEGKTKSDAPQNEAYRLLIVAVSNYWNKVMPFLFQKINDYTELLMPDDLLSGTSILAFTREAMTPENCADVESLGWLYQFYISEKKDEVFDNLKKNQKITTENIPAATQLFTPSWIVRYLVENSLGRLWMLNKPNSKLATQMEYYIKPDPEQKETDFLKISSPEDIKICDPACGSGHILVYAFDLLYAIYEEEGYDIQDISSKILKHNLFGIEIDKRAGELAAFALTMKAREKHRRFFNTNSIPQICVLQNIIVGEQSFNEYVKLFNNTQAEALQYLCTQFEEAKTFGSLIRPLPAHIDLTDFDELSRAVNTIDIKNNMLLDSVQANILTALKQADFLQQKYHVVIANPPYMGGKNMNSDLSEWLKKNYTDVKSDLFSAFIVRNTELALPKGQLGFMTPFVWMFISSYEKLRSFIIKQKTITSLIQLEYSGFDGATVPICTFTLENAHKPNFKGGYIRLADFKGAENQAPRTLEAIKNPNCGWFYRVSADNFQKIPDSPIAYWASERILEVFESSPSLETIAKPRQGMATTNNDVFLRLWYEVEDCKTFVCATDKKDAIISNKKWFPYNKGGEFRKWYGNNDYLINWYNDGEEIRKYLIGKNPNIPRGERLYFKQCFSWSLISSSSPAFRFKPNGHIFDIAGMSCFTEEYLYYLLALCNSPIVLKFLKILAPTINYQAGDIANIPVIIDSKQKQNIEEITEQNISLSKIDWDAYETSWDFKKHPLI